MSTDCIKIESDGADKALWVYDTGWPGVWGVMRVTEIAGAFFPVYEVEDYGLFLGRQRAMRAAAVILFHGKKAKKVTR